MEKILLEECCEILDSKRIPITASNRKAGSYPYYGANGIQDFVDDYIFDVPKQEIVDNDYDLSINKYKKVEYVPVEYPSTTEIMTELYELQMKISEGMEELNSLLGL